MGLRPPRKPSESGKQYAERLEREVCTYSGDDGVSIPVVAAVLSRPSEAVPIFCRDCGFGPVELPSNLIAWCPDCGHDWSYA